MLHPGAPLLNGPYGGSKGEAFLPVTARPVISTLNSSLSTLSERGIEMNQRTQDALSGAIYLSRLALRGEAVDSDDKRLRASGLYPEWSPGVHAKGDIYNAGGQTWECIQDYDSGVYPDIVPGGAAWGTFHRPLHGAAPETAREFVPVTGVHDTYQPGEYAWFQGRLYRCGAETAYSPEEAPRAWSQLGIRN